MRTKSSEVELENARMVRILQPDAQTGQKSVPASCEDLSDNSIHKGGRNKI
jgi:hypothetical protein